MEPETHTEYTASELLAALRLVGRLLLEAGQGFDVVVIGGANLAIQSLVSRTTGDVDVVAARREGAAAFECAQPLPDDLRRAVEDAAEILRLPPRWMNGAASSDFDLGLPPGYEERAKREVFGGLNVWLADRQDIVAWKLQAAVDNLGASNRHMRDLVQLEATADEIRAAEEWFAMVEGPTSGFWVNLRTVLAELGHA